MILRRAPGSTFRQLDYEVEHHRRSTTNDQLVEGARSLRLSTSIAEPQRTHLREDRSPQRNSAFQFIAASVSLLVCSASPSTHRLTQDAWLFKGHTGTNVRGRAKNADTNRTHWEHPRGFPRLLTAMNEYRDGRISAAELQSAEADAVRDTIARMEATGLRLSPMGSRRSRASQLIR